MAQPWEKHLWKATSGTASQPNPGRFANVLRMHPDHVPFTTIPAARSDAEHGPLWSANGTWAEVSCAAQFFSLLAACLWEG